MTFTFEQLSQFAEAGGWKEKLTDDLTDSGSGRMVSDVWVSPDGYLHDSLPDFLRNLAACFEVLEVVASEGWSLHCYKHQDGSIRYSLQMVSKWSSGPRGDTKQAAIIAAVLATKEGK